MLRKHSLFSCATPTTTQNEYTDRWKGYCFQTPKPKAQLSCFVMPKALPQPAMLSSAATCHGLRDCRVTANSVAQTAPQRRTPTYRYTGPCRRSRYRRNSAPIHCFGPFIPAPIHAASGLQPRPARTEMHQYTGGGGRARSAYRCISGLWATYFLPVGAVYQHIGVSAHWHVGRAVCRRIAVFPPGGGRGACESVIPAHQRIGVRAYRRKTVLRYFTTPFARMLCLRLDGFEKMALTHSGRIREIFFSPKSIE